MHTYIFQTGRSTELCQLELDLLLFQYKPILVFRNEEISVVEFNESIPLEAIIGASGSVIKVAPVVGYSRDDVDYEYIVGVFSKYVEEQLSEHKKITFGVSYYGKTGFSASEVTKALKVRLSEMGQSSQFVLGSGNDLSSVQVAKEGLLGARGVEFVIVQTDRGFVWGRTSGVQDFERWSEIDYGRPGRDLKSGMLPPKVARMMVNIGLCEYLRSIDSASTPIVYDPFCGSGTVLTEAMQLGCAIVGSDNSLKAVEDTKRNIEWVKSGSRTIVEPRYYQFPLYESVEPKVFLSESVHVFKELGEESVDVIVSEPYMGPTFTEDPTPGKQERIMKGLEKLYIGSFKEFARVLKKGGILVFAEPEYHMRGKVSKIGIIDKATQFGYTPTNVFVSYRREQAFVGRRIAVLKKN